MNYVKRQHEKTQRGYGGVEGEGEGTEVVCKMEKKDIRPEGQYLLLLWSRSPLVPGFWHY